MPEDDDWVTIPHLTEYYIAGPVVGLGDRATWVDREPEDAEA